MHHIGKGELVSNKLERAANSFLRLGREVSAGISLSLEANKICMFKLLKAAGLNAINAFTWVIIFAFPEVFCELS